ncbi:MAG: M20/M25/M40 family metallo-hydrolase, partial [Verrucomicrobiota bacterium]
AGIEAADRNGLQAKVIAVATAQEEIGCRGARTVANRKQPDFALAVDVGHATDHPECDNKKFGEFTLGGGPIITRGANIHPHVFERLIACADKAGVPYQVEADPRPTGTDGRELQMGHGGIATGVVSIPLRYMHTAAEIVDLADVEHTVQLLTAFCRSLTADDTNVW